MALTKKKSFRSLLLMAVLVGIMLSCSSNEEGQPVSQGQVQFKIHALDDILENSRVMGTINLERSYLNIFLRHHQTGEDFHVLFERLVDLHGQIVSPTLTLPPGDYEVTNFVVGDYDLNYAVIYAVPEEESELADLVDVTVPFNISVYEGAIENISIELLSTNVFGSGKFGLELTDVEVFRLAIYAEDSSSGEYVPSSASISLRQDNTVFMNKSLNAGVNNIYVKEDYWYDETELTISKPGYNDYTEIISIYNLIGYQSTTSSVAKDIYLEIE